MTGNHRDTIFISHATPEDNEFTIWLASRLELLGYRVWIDKKELLGGETFWSDIEKIINDRAAKFLLVYSNNILNHKQEVKGGIQREINLATNLVRQNPELKDFIIILNIDDAPYDLFPGSADVNQITFRSNWANGLTTLYKKLEKDQLPKASNDASYSAGWYLKNYIVKNPVIRKKELYYTNWLNIDSLPDYYYILKFQNEPQAKAIYELNQTELIVRNANYIVTFNKNLNFEIVDTFGKSELIPIVFDLKISELGSNYDSAVFPTSQDAENQLKKLLKRTMHLFLKERRLSWYELSNKHLAYYHTPASLPTSKVKYHYPTHKNGKSKWKQLFGKYLTIGKWHYALSIRPALSPNLSFHLKSHLVFTTNGHKALEEKSLQHSYRRKKGRLMFNEAWRDLIVAFVHSLSDNTEAILIPTGTDTPIVLKSHVELLWSDFGYYDPKDKSRQGIFNHKEEQIEDPTDESTEETIEDLDNTHEL